MPICDRCKKEVDSYHIIWKHDTWFKHANRWKKIEKTPHLVCFGCVKNYTNYDIVLTNSNNTIIFNADSKHNPIPIMNQEKVEMNE